MVIEKNSVVAGCGITKKQLLIAISVLIFLTNFFYLAFIP